MSVRPVSHDPDPELAADIDIDDRTLSREAIPEEWHYPVFEAETFVIHGPASVEVVDRKGQEVKMEAFTGLSPAELRADDRVTVSEMDLAERGDAFESALDRFMNSDLAPGIVSKEHDDIPVGVPVWEYTTDEGETFRTEVRDDTFYLTAKLANDTEKAKECRLRALDGSYDGYSVTIFSKYEHTRESDGARVTLDADLHAVTLGNQSITVNQEASFEPVDWKYGIDIRGEVGAQLRRKFRQRDGVREAIRRRL
jgi:predicted transcriptional regulator